MAAPPVEAAEDTLGSLLTSLEDDEDDVVVVVVVELDETEDDGGSSLTFVTAAEALLSDLTLLPRAPASVFEVADEGGGSSAAFFCSLSIIF